MTSDVDIEVLSYVRAWDGVLTAMHDVVPSEEEGTRHRVSMFNPEVGVTQENRLKLINPGGGSAEVTISGVDARGRSLGDAVALTLPAGASSTYTAAELASGSGAGLRGSLGGVTGEWQLTVGSEQPLQVMSLLSSPTGHLSNLSTAPVLVPKIPPPVSQTDPETPDAGTLEDVFRTEVSPIVQSKCVLCHVQGGVSGNTRLVFVPATNTDHVALNLAMFEALIAVLEEDEQVEDPATYILNKVQGVGHGGGVQAAAGTDDYASLERFLGLLGEAVAPAAITPETLFEGVTMESARSTLRRAAIVFAGRVPTNAEYAAIESASDEEEGSEEALRTAIRGLMTGPGFHEFLIRASNDRLLTDRELNDTIQGHAQLVGYTNRRAELLSAADESGDFSDFRDWNTAVQYGAARAPLELIALVAQQDRDYREILTGDYVMANPMAAQAYGAATVFDDPTDVHEFRPSEIDVANHRRCDGWELEDRGGEWYIRKADPCVLRYPHAGVLNAKAFLQRYPTTATNRNRARSRWTYYHFLGLDVEESASRTTDPVALADTNNPTMFNSACTVCHSVLDPVAGAFQNYSDVGWYRDQGEDSLDKFYKNDRGTALSVEGDSWVDRSTLSWMLSLQSGTNELAVDFTNDFYDEATGDDGFLYLDVLRVSDEDGVVDEIEFEDVGPPMASQGPCGNVRDNPVGGGRHLALWNGGRHTARFGSI